jgi:hypothetical protein
MANNNIELHIEKLALYGFSPHDRHRIGKAVERKLTRMLTEQGMPTSLSHGGELPHINGSTFNTATNTNAGTIGTQIAQSIYSGLNKSHQPTGKTKS